MGSSLSNIEALLYDAAADFVQHERIFQVTGVGKAICQPTYPAFPIWSADPSLDSAPEGFCENA